MNAAPVNSANKTINSIKAINTEYKRIDRWCETTIKLSFLASTLFASIALVFHHFKSVDSMRLSFYLFGANLLVAATTSFVYLYIINKKNYDTARQADADMHAALLGFYKNENTASLTAAQAKVAAAEEKFYTVKSQLVDEKIKKIKDGNAGDYAQQLEAKKAELKVQDAFKLLPDDALTELAKAALKKK